MTLPAEDRRAILEGEFPQLSGTDRFQVGQMIQLTKRVSIRIEKRNLRRGLVTWDYTVIDFRDRFLKRRLPTDHRGYVEAERLNGEEIRKASERSHYDANPRDPMDAGASVPPEYQNVISLNARTRSAEAVERADDRRRSQVRSVTERIREKAKAGDLTDQQLAQIHRTLGEDDLDPAAA